MVFQVPLALQLSHVYRNQHHIPEFDPIDFDKNASIRCADFYDALPFGMCETPEVIASYEVFKEHLIQQFQLMMDHDFIVIDGQGVHEYKTSDELRKDLALGKIIYRPTYSENATLSEINDKHPLASSVVINNCPWLINDIFRIVHDFYGHGPGNSFSPSGEHYAWLAHRSILPVEARIALFCETRGQSSWVNFGKHIRDADKILSPSERPFAPQKIGLVPLDLI